MRKLETLKDLGIEAIQKGNALAWKFAYAPLDLLAWNEGYLASALEIMDSCINECNTGTCILIETDFMDCLNDLSVSRCLELKGFHRSRTHTDWSDCVGDYYDSLKEIKTWQNVQCSKYAYHGVPAWQRLVLDYYQNNFEKIRSKKAYWNWMTYKWKSWDDNSKEAKLLMEWLVATMESSDVPDLEHLHTKSAMASVLDYLAVSCKKKCGR